MIPDDALAEFVVILAWLAMGTVAAIWLLGKAWRVGHRLIDRYFGARP